MSWIRKVTIEAIWECDKAPLPHSVPVEIEDTYDYKPRRAILNWVSNVATETVLIMCRRSCHELSDSVFCDENTVDYVVTDGPTEEGEEIEKEKPPKYIIDEMEYMQKLYKESEDVDEKLALKEEIDALKERYDFEQDSEQK